MSSNEVDSMARCPGCEAAFFGHRCETCGAAARAGSYRMVRVLAEGEGGRTYLAEDQDGRRVTLKELVLLEAPPERWIEWFYRQARVLRRLSHPRLPRWLDAFEDGAGAQKRLYIAQEHVEGESLLERLSHHRYNEREALVVARKVLSILLYLHRQRPRLIHRDIKPANLIQDDEGTIFLVDFGSAFELSEESAKGRTHTGTIGYAPVEQLGGMVDQWCDLHGVGATLMHLLTRVPPWELVRDGRLPTDTRELDVSPKMRSFLDGLLSGDEKKRFSSAAEALRALDELEQGAATESSSWKLLAGGLAASGAIVVLAAVLLNVGAPAEVPVSESAEPPPPTEPEPEPEPPPPPEPEPSPPPPAPREPVDADVHEDEPFEFSVSASVELVSHRPGYRSFWARRVEVAPSAASRAFPRNEIAIRGECRSHGATKRCPVSDWVALHDESGKRLPLGIASTNQSSDTVLATTLPPEERRILLTFGPSEAPYGRWVIDLDEQRLMDLP